MRFCAVLSLALALLAGCASISIDEPANNSVKARPPVAVKVTEKGFVDFDDPRLDGFNLSRYNGQNFQYVPQSTLFYVPPGSHTLFVPARDGKWHTNISQSSSFTVTACPLCYSCPVGNVHPVTGQCCDNGVCDKWAFGNFGPSFYNTARCQQPVFPAATGQRYWDEFDCISSQIELVRGGAAPRMLAVSFTPNESGALRHLQAPVGRRSGTNSLLVWVTANGSNNAPGQVLESLTVNTIRTQPTATTAYPPVDAPAHIFFSGATQLTAGTRYWLVLGPGAADTDIAWNLSLEDFSLPADTTFLVNTTNSSITGPWARKTPNLADQRPAFEIDVR